MKSDPDCTLCRLHRSASRVCVLGSGPRKSEVAIVVEKPSRSGKVELPQEMVDALKRHGITDYFVLAAVSCRPPEGKKPSKGELRACNKWLNYQLDAVGAKFVLLIGGSAYQAVTESGGIKAARGKPFERDGRVYLPTFSHASADYDASAATKIEVDLRLLAKCIQVGGIPREEKLNIRMVRTRDDFEQMIRDLSGIVSFDLETTCLYPWGEPIFKKRDGIKVQEGFVKAEITSIGFGTAKTQWIIHTPAIKGSKWTWQNMRDMVKRILARLRDSDVRLVMHNGKFDCLWMMVHFDVDLTPFFYFDTMLAHYAHNENDAHGLKYLAQYYCGAPDWEIDKDTKRGVGNPEKLAMYHAHDLFYTRKLLFVLRSLLREDAPVMQVFFEILMPCARLFVEIEFDGVFIDLNKMGDAEKFLRDQKAAAEKDMRKWGNINFGSSQQLAKLLFTDLKIPVVEETKGGAPSTSESVIKRIDHPIAASILKFREAKQQLSFFIEGWQPYLDGEYLHPSFKLHGTVTGRLSCEHPNLQQVPRDKRIRQLITAPKGWTLVECDLSQIELRIAAELAQEPAMLEAFIKGIDVHWMTCLREIERGGGLKDLVCDTARTWKQDKSISYADAFEVLIEMGPDAAADINEEWKEYRKKAKAINFGYLYGMWWKKFKLYARDNYGVTITDEQAEASREFFFDSYDFEPWHRRQRRYVRRHGYVSTLSGRKRRLPDAMQDYNEAARKAAERQAINSPVQSFANEINLMAAIQLRKEFGRDVVRMCGTVHDAILMRVKDEHVERVTTRLLEIMQRPALFDLFNIDLTVPVMAEAKVGPWGASISFDKWKAERRKPNVQRVRGVPKQNKALAKMPLRRVPALR